MSGACARCTLGTSIRGTIVNRSYFGASSYWSWFAWSDVAHFESLPTGSTEHGGQPASFYPINCIGLHVHNAFTIHCCAIFFDSPWKYLIYLSCTSNASGIMQSSSYWRHQQRPLRRPAEALTREVYSGPQERLGSQLNVLTRKRLLSFTQGVFIVILFPLVTCGISFWHVFWMPQGRAQYLNCSFI
jgi:hypothetical protein